MEEWKNYNWGQICELKYGKGLKGYRDLKGDIPVYGTNGYIGQTEKALCENNGIIVGRKGAYRGIHYSPVPFYVIDTAFFLVPSIENLDIKFAYYQLLTQDINGLDSGSAIPSTSREDFYSLKVSLPPLKEQKAIASILSALDDKIENNLQMNKTLEEMAMVLYKHWFVDFGPFQDGEFIGSELGEIPKGWEVKSIYDLAEVIYGAPFKSKLFNENKNGYPLIRIRDLKTNQPSFYTEQDHPKKTVIKPGDILAGMDAEFDPYVWLGEDGVLNQRVVHFKPKTKFIKKRFLYEAVKPWLAYFARAKVGTTVIHLGKGDIDTFKLIYPNDHEILKPFNQEIEAYHEKIVSNGNENKLLVKLRDTLLPKLISGEVRVKDVEKTLSEVL